MSKITKKPTNFKFDMTCHTQTINLQNKNVVVRMPNWLGDAVMATACLKDLAAHIAKQNGRLTVLAQDSIVSLLQHTPLVHEFIPFSRNSTLKQSEACRIQKRLIEKQFDVGLLFTGSFSSAWQFYRAHIPVRIGFSTHFRSLLLTHPVKEAQNRDNIHLCTLYKQLLLPFGIAESSSAPELYVTEEEKKEALSIVKSHAITTKNTIIGINPAAAYGSAKCWPKDRFEALSKELTKNENVRLLFFGDSSSRQTIDSMCHDLGSKVVNLAGKTNIRMLLALMSTCNLFITNDSGPMHIANALEIPLVAIFGSTNSTKTGPYGSVNHAPGVVIQKKVACSPCYLRSCPIDFRCMKAIDVEDVLSVVRHYV